MNSIVSTAPQLENIIKQQITNEIVELTDAVSYSGQQIGNIQNKHNVSALSTPVSRHTPMVQMNNAIQTGVHLHRPEPQPAYTEQLQHLQNLQQYFNSQRQTPLPSLEPLPIPQLIAAAYTPRISRPVVEPSNASNASNKSNTSNILAAVSANLVYGAVNTNRSQNITPATSKPASVKSEVEPMVIPHHQFVRNISIPDIGNIYESGANITGDTNNDNNVVIDILPLTHNNLSIHENAMIQQQPHQPDLSSQVEIPINIVELPNNISTLPVVSDNLDPDGMM
jgi:hypothetical protein